MASAIRQNSQLMNMMTQQAAAQRQTQQAQQAMAIARAVEERVVAAEPGRLQGGALERLGRASEMFRNALTGVTFGDVARTTAVRAEAVRISPELDALLPSVEKLVTDRLTYDLAYMTAAEIADRRFPKAKADTVIDPRTNQVRAVNVGGMPGASFSQDIPDISGSIPQSPAPQAMGSAPPPAMGSNNMATPSRGADTTPQDLLRQGVNPNSIPLGNPLQPMSMTTGGGDQAAQQDLGAIVQTMMQTGVISQSGLDAMRAAAPGKEDQLAQIMRENNIQILPNEGEAPGMSNAVLRSGDAMPQRQDVQYAPSQYPPTYGKDPMQSPTQNPAAAGATAGATESATQGVRLNTQPKIEAANERVRRMEKLRGAAPAAKNATIDLIADIDDRIKTIDAFLRNPARREINGPIEGNLPRVMQYGPRADAQAAFDQIKDTTTLMSMIDLRKSTETGANPVGANPTDRDAALVAQAASKLIQTGTLIALETEVQRLRDKLYRTRVSALNTYNDTYADLMPEMPGLRVSAPYIAPKYTPRAQTDSSVDYNNPLLRD